MSEALRSFGLVDSFGLRGLIDSEKLPSKRSLIQHLNSGTKSLPPSISADFVASSVLAVLSDTDQQKSTKSKSAPRFNFESIKPGRDQAGKYHKTVFGALQYAFSGILENGKVERDVDQGRKRIDIRFENPNKLRFFRDLEKRHQIFCPIIFIECKNYSHDPENPEFDQLQGRFHNKRGRFGILVCRSIINNKTKAARCGDIVSSGNGCVLVLEDTDILALVGARQNNDLITINSLLSEKLTEVLSNAHS